MNQPQFEDQRGRTDPSLAFAELSKIVIGAEPLQATPQRISKRLASIREPAVS
jgi:hypothetical protein